VPAPRVIAARKRAEREALLPPGPKVVVTGGLDDDDYRMIWDRFGERSARRRPTISDRCREIFAPRLPSR
jgi:hypothetical protein